MKINFCLSAVVCFATLAASMADGQIVDFTENFENGPANFVGAQRIAVGDAGSDAQFFSTGGLNDSAFFRGTTDPDSQGVVIRAEIDDRTQLATGGPASDGAFAGDYLASNVESVSFYLRHNASADASFSARFATGANFPAINTVLGTLSPSDEFTKFTIDFTDQTNFSIEGFPGLTFASVASQIGNIQITTLSDATETYSVDVDDFSITTARTIILGDVSVDGVVDFLDISPFIAVLSVGEYQEEADINSDGLVNFLDISPFISILSGQ